MKIKELEQLEKDVNLLFKKLEKETRSEVALFKSLIQEVSVKHNFMVNEKKFSDIIEEIYEEIFLKS